LRMPEGARPVAILCLGHVEEFYPQPMLQAEGWAQRVALHDCLRKQMGRRGGACDEATA